MPRRAEGRRSAAGIGARAFRPASAKLRFRDLRRQPPRCEPRPRFLILCEGRRTEPAYFRDLAADLRHPLVALEIEDEGGTPKTLVERAARRKRQADRAARSRRDAFLRFDEVWCVFDVDEHPHLAAARQQAMDNGIRLAVSNPSFELWALLHFQAQTAYLDRQAARTRLQAYLPGYRKLIPFERLRSLYRVAVNRALHLERRCESAGMAGGNPSTGVHLLTERLHETRRIS